MRSVCSCSCFGCCFGGSGLPPPFASVSAGSPPLGIIFGDLSDNKYPLRDAGHQLLLALSFAY